jgi:hypothetical protein
MAEQEQIKKEIKKIIKELSKKMNVNRVLRQERKW